LQRVFSTFPDGLPGAGLLLLRSTAGIALLIQGSAYFVDRYNFGLLTMAIAFATIVISALLLIGYLTPFAAGLAGLVSISNVFPWFPAPTPDLFEARVAALLATAIVTALVCLGPGAFSLDARRFGRREIVIPTRVQ
jgi:uncharacterized membrane protein YphA (DoxX/SURF4 family)